MLVIIAGFVAIVGTGGGSGDAPAAAITSPADNSSYPIGDIVSFVGAGTDTEDGDLDASVFAWTSSLDGQLNAGDKSFSTYTLSVGTHTITLTVTDSDGNAGSDSITISVINPPSAPVPDTGQTTCYGADGAVLNPCPSAGEDFYGQDACYTINPPSYTKLDASGTELADDAADWVMVKDNVTGLVWEVKTDDGSIHDKDNTYTWYDSNPATNGGDAGTAGVGTDTEDFINDLNAASFGGHEDWRLPTINELRSIVDYGTYNPAIDTVYFPNTMSSYYWSSTSRASYTGDAWLVNFDGGYDYNLNKANTYYVRAVRGGQSSMDFTDNGDGTVTDNVTGLMWQQATADSMTWEAALAYCEGLPLAGYSDWRLPTIRELCSIVDYGTYSPAIDTEYFPDTMSSNYWSSTSNASHTDSAWLVYFNYGYDDYDYKANTYYVRVVRSGQ